MTCRRCHGLALREVVSDVNEGLWYEQWKCINCERVLSMGPLLTRIPYVDRTVEKVGRWRHQQ